MRDRIQNAGILFSSEHAFLWTCSITEEPLEREARIYFGWKGLRRGWPRNAVRIRTAVTKVATAEVSGVLDSELERRQNRVLPPFLGDELVDRHAEIRADGIATRTSAGENACPAGMITR